MIKLGNLCHCKFCRSKKNALLVLLNGAIIDATANKLRQAITLIVDDKKYSARHVIVTGGRNPEWIFLNHDEYYTIKRKPYCGQIENEIERFDASTHGCWKRLKNRVLIVFKK